MREMTRIELEKQHKIYSAYLAEWLFYLRAYFGGKFYSDGNYLVRHPFESDANYTRRKSIAYYYNYCAPVVDIMVAYLYQRTPKRSYGAWSPTPVPPRRPNTLFDSFWWDVDFEGSSLDQFMMKAQRFSSVYGRVNIIVDRPHLSAYSQSDALAKDIRPYFTLITPEKMIDWAYDKYESGKPFLAMIKILEIEERDNIGNIIYRRFKIWTPEKWETWDVKGAEISLVKAGVNPLGKIPIVTLYNKQAGVRQLGLSDIKDIAHINKNIYYVCSDAKEIIENTAFPMLSLPYDAGAGETQEVSAKNILQFDPDKPGSKPEWLEPPHSSLAELREWVQQDAQEIARIALMGGLRNVETSTQPWSGLSIKTLAQQLYAVLCEKADNAEQAELDLLRLYGDWESSPFEGDVVYNRDFAVEDITDLQTSIQALGAEVSSKLFEKERQKKAVDAVLPVLDEALRDQIHGEIDATGMEQNTSGNNMEQDMAAQ